MRIKLTRIWLLPFFAIAEAVCLALLWPIAFATQATVICATPDGVRKERTISRKSGLTEYDCERIGRAWENAQASPAKYIMLEIQREGEP